MEKKLKDAIKNRNHFESKFIKLHVDYEKVTRDLQHCFNAPWEGKWYDHQTKTGTSDP